MLMTAVSLWLCRIREVQALIAKSGCANVWDVLQYEKRT